MTVTAVVNVHFGENLKEEEKRDGAKVHIVEIHDGDIFFVVVGSHFEVGNDE
jgi:hypothetical protein